MSKAKLKKELIRLSTEQLTELLCDVYTKCKDAKAYLDFYCDPDEDALYDKYKITIEKETGRSKRGTSRARISKIRNALKEFSGYGTNPRLVYKLTLHAAWHIMYYERVYHMNHSLVNGCCDLFLNALDIADKNLFYDEAVSDIKNILMSPIGSASMVKLIRSVLDNGL